MQRNAAARFTLAITAALAFGLVANCSEDRAPTSPESPVALTLSSHAATITGTTGEIVDPLAPSGGFCLRYVGDPAALGSHTCQWGTPFLLTANPEVAPVTMEGTIDVSAQDIDNVAFIGLIDRDDLAGGDPPNGWLDGAYIYILRTSATEWRIGPSDGNGTGPPGELIQVFSEFSIADLPTGILNVTFTIDGTVPGTDCASPSAAGCLTLHMVGGTIDETLTDGYGEKLGPGSADPEFSNGGIPGWDDEEGLRVSNVGYDLTISPLVVGGEPDDPQTKDDCKNGGWEQFGFKNQGQCIRFVNTGKDSR